MTVTRLVRVAYFLLSWAFVVGLTVQVFLIGLSVFGRDGAATQAHAGLGWILHLVPLVLVPLAYFARTRRADWLAAIALAVVIFAVPIFAVARDNAIVAALHPVAAVAGFALALLVALNATGALRSTTSSAASESPAHT